MTEDRTHYSYTTYADPETARSFDRRRFGGPIGELVAKSQARVLIDFVGRDGNIATMSVVDVGAGTGRASLLLARAGADVTAVDASREMLAIAERRATEESEVTAPARPIHFVVGDAHALEFADQSFDAAVSLRVLMHTPEWRRCLGELCRVARHAVVIDYPSARSVAVVESVLRKGAHALGVKTEAYRVFGAGTLTKELEAHGFRVRAVHRQFVLPIAFHKAIGSRVFTRAIEGGLERVGLLRLFGSPITVVAERCASS